MLKNIMTVIYFVLLYLLIYFTLEAIPYGIQYAEMYLPSMIAFIILFPLKCIILVAIMYGYLGDFYLWWKIKPVLVVQKIIVWLSRIGIVFLVVITIPQIIFLIFDRDMKEVALSTIRYNWISDLGFKGAALLVAYQLVAYHYLKQKVIFMKNVHPHHV